MAMEANARPGHAWRPNPKCMLSTPMVTSDFGVAPSLQRKPSKVDALGTMALSWLSGPDGKQMWIPSGRWNPSLSVSGCLVMRWKFTVLVVSGFGGGRERREGGGFTFGAGVEALGFTKEAVETTQREEFLECALCPAALQSRGDLLAEWEDVFRVQDQIVQSVGKGHCAGVHDGETHKDEQVLGEEVGLVVAVGLGQVKHPLQEVVGLFVRGVALLCCSASVYHGDEELLLGVLHLLLERFDAGEELGDEWTHEVWEWAEEDHSDANIDCVVGDDVQPVLVTRDFLAGDDP